jgi:hypothetical protein
LSFKERSKSQEARIKSQEARAKNQESRARKQEPGSKSQDSRARKQDKPQKYAPITIYAATIPPQGSAMDSITPRLHPENS